MQSPRFECSHDWAGLRDIGGQPNICRILAKCDEVYTEMGYRGCSDELEEVKTNH